MKTPHKGRLPAANTEVDARIQSILEYPGYSSWLKSALRLALFRDCGDVAREAAILAEVLEIRAEALRGNVRR
jgi:hypothetical protein